MKKDDTFRSQFRLPYELYEKLKEESEKNHRSLNAEIVARLQDSFLGVATNASGTSLLARDNSQGVTVENHLREIAKEMSLNFSQQAAKEIEETLRKEREQYYKSGLSKQFVEEAYGQDFLPDILSAIEKTQRDMQELHASLQRYMRDIKDAE